MVWHLRFVVKLVFPTLTYCLRETPTKFSDPTPPTASPIKADKSARSLKVKKTPVNHIDIINLNSCLEALSVVSNTAVEAAAGNDSELHSSCEG